MNDRQSQPHLTDDPLVGTQRTTDSPAEARATPDAEVTLRPTPTGPAVKSRSVAGWLGIFFGWLGLHRFYLGYTKVGLVQAAVGIGAALVAIIAGLFLAPTTGLTMGQTLFVAAHVAVIGVIWGLFEGVMILLGGLRYDAHLRPLR